eukprot:CAMPEP_0182898536 /NCGR_PEP_ID=MMETSP0034_2-20130328/27544_1 /TAXON_ID=156128 /ORGANISM="Nephroselmis pyriformis, Strain CCMP717" /LENGTH=48 /DNA_ID= /DNA_START= /DNA_END= /DNA_ORIENTATION=
MTHPQLAALNPAANSDASPAREVTCTSTSRPAASSTGMMSMSNTLRDR